MNDRKLPSRTTGGFTLVEILLYIALSGLFIAAMVPFSLNIFGLYAKAAVARETSAVARGIAEEIVSAIRSADGVDADGSAFGAEQGRLSLDQVGTSDRLTIDVDDGTLRFRMGNASPVPLHGSSVFVDSIVFENRSSDDETTEHVDFTLVVSAGAASGRQEYRSEVAIEGGAELRNNSL